MKNNKLFILIIILLIIILFIVDMVKRMKFMKIKDEQYVEEKEKIVSITLQKL